jgi:hypothetical protein
MPTVSHVMVFLLLGHAKPLCSACCGVRGIEVTHVSHSAESSFIIGAPRPSDSHLWSIGVWYILHAIHSRVRFNNRYSNCSNKWTVQPCWICSPHASHTFWSDFSGIGAFFVLLYFLPNLLHFKLKRRPLGSSDPGAGLFLSIWTGYCEVWGFHSSGVESSCMWFVAKTNLLPGPHTLEQEGTTFLRNVGNQSPNDAVSHLRRAEFPRHCFSFPCNPN